MFDPNGTVFLCRKQKHCVRENYNALTNSYFRCNGEWSDSHETAGNPEDK